MNATPSVALATWMLEHVAPHRYGEALIGDLLEELHSGRSVLWYWRQVIRAAAACVLGVVQTWLPSVIFSAAWSLVYPAWQLTLWHSRFSQSLFNHWSSLVWPLSASANIGRGFLPCATWIWLGLFVYILLRGAARLSLVRIAGGLSLSLNVLLIATIALERGHHLINLPLILSLLSAILIAFPPSRQSRTTASV